MSARPSHAYAAARERIEKYVAELARDKGIGVIVTVDSDTSREVVSTHAIALTVGGRTRVVSVDNATFLEDDAFLGVFLLPQIEMAVEELAG